MHDSWLKGWDKKFSEKTYAYGTEPNVFFKEQLDKIQSGKILCGAEGEGRNAVYAAKSGWIVSAFDISIEGKKKAIQLAEFNNVQIDYQVGELPYLNFENESFDVIALIYAHFPPQIRTEYFKVLRNKLKPNGLIIFEAFGENHLELKKKNPNVGGPSKQELLFTQTELKKYFPDYELLILSEEEVNLQQGKYHNGTGSVIRLVAKKYNEHLS